MNNLIIGLIGFLIIIELLQHIKISQLKSEIEYHKSKNERITKLLQRICGANVDGIWGRESSEKYSNTIDLLNKIKKKRGY